MAALDRRGAWLLALMFPLLLLLLPHPASALSLAAPHGAAVTATGAAATAAPQQLDLIEHAMRVMPPHLYEAELRQAFAERGEILRWYIARVDDEAGTAIAEVVILPHAHGAQS